MIVTISVAFDCRDQVRFILAVIRGDIVISNRPKKDLMAELKAKNFSPFPSKTAVKAGADEDASDDNASQAGESGSSSDDYDYLLRMPLWSLTLEKVFILKIYEISLKDAEGAKTYARARR